MDEKELIAGLEKIEDSIPLAQKMGDAITRTKTISYLESLPDSSFLVVSKRFVVKDSIGRIDIPALKHALENIPNSDLPDAQKESALAQAKVLANKCLGYFKDGTAISELIFFKTGEEITKAAKEKIKELKVELKEAKAREKKGEVRDMDERDSRWIQEDIDELALIQKNIEKDMTYSLTVWDLKRYGF